VRDSNPRSVGLDRINELLNSAVDFRLPIAANYREDNHLGLVDRTSQWYTVCCICPRKIPS